MILFRLCKVLIFVFSISDAKTLYAESVSDSGPFDQEYKTKFLKNVNILNKLQAKLLNLSYTPEEVTLESLEANAGQNRMKNPYLFEGDIVLTDDQWNIIIENAREQLRAREAPSETPKKLAMTSKLARRWTLPIPFYIRPELNVNMILSVIKQFESETCVRFKRYNEPVSDSLSSLEFVGDDCNSAIGMIGGRQQISIGIGCEFIGSIWHEIAHALGVLHEQNRYDRDNYVHIDYNNIDAPDTIFFLKYPVNEMFVYGIEYDIGSVMHFGTNDCSKNGRPTILPRDLVYANTPGTVLAPSFKDVQGINAAYCSSTCSNTLNCLNGGYLNPSNCNSCNCPRGLGGKLCGVAAKPAVGCGNGDLTATSNMKTLTASGQSTCYYLITAPPGKQVFFDVTFIDMPYVPNRPCIISYLEINFTLDFTKSGARFCSLLGGPLPINRSVGNRLMVTFAGFPNVDVSSFSMNYRIAY